MTDKTEQHFVCSLVSCAAQLHFLCSPFLLNIFSHFLLKRLWLLFRSEDIVLIGEMIVFLFGCSTECIQCAGPSCIVNRQFVELRL